MKAESLTTVAIPTEQLDALEAEDRHLRSLLGRLADGPVTAADEAELQEALRRRRLLAVEVGLRVLEQARANIPHRPEVVDLAVPESVADPEAPAVVVADPRALEEFKRVGRLSTGASLVATGPGRMDVFWDVLDDMGEPPDVSSDEGRRGELDRLERVVLAHPEGWWMDVPNDVWKAWVAELVARIRAVEAAGDLTGRARGLGRSVLSWVKAKPAGYVVGLQLNSHPQGSSWTVDAHAHAQRVHLALGDGGARRAHAALKSQREPLEREDSPLHLPLLAALQKPVVVIGGEADTQKLDRLRARTSVALEWVECAEGDRVARRVRDGHVAAVIVLNSLGGHSKLADVLASTRERGVLLEYAKKGGLASLASALQELEVRLAA